jgi:hypothetical protein
MASPNGSHATNLAIQVNQFYAIEASGKCQIKEEDSTSVNMELAGFGPRPTTFPAAAGSIANTKKYECSEVRVRLPAGMAVNDCGSFESGTGLTDFHSRGADARAA